MLSANVTTLLAAIVAVLGTLTSASLTQRYTSRARSQEIEATRQQRQEDREERQRTSLLDRRQNYTALHTAAWEFRRALKNALLGDDGAGELEGARQAFVATYRNSQMICTDPVLSAAVPAYVRLTDAYGRVRKLLPGTSGNAEPALPRTEDRKAVERALDNAVAEAIRGMRQAMRVDLGVVDDGPDGAEDQGHQVSSGETMPVLPR